MAFVVIYDACVLYPAALRDFILRVARTGIVRARWSEHILDECFAAIMRERPDLNPEALARTRELMSEAIPDCIVSGYEHLIDGLALPDPNDRHVLAAAIRSGAQSVVTFNVKHFPPARIGLGFRAGSASRSTLSCTRERASRSSYRWRPPKRSL